MRKIKEIFKSPQLRYGTYSTAMVAVVIAIVIVINMIATQFGGDFNAIDLTDNQLYEVTETSKAMLSEMESKVELIVLAEKDSVDDRIKTFLDNYVELTDKVSLKWIDPVSHPSALTEYDAETNTIVVKCADTEKQEIIYLSDMIEYDYSSYYTTNSVSESAFDAEGQLTSAIYSVINDVEKKIYVTTGHGETAISTTINNLFDKANFTTEELNTLMASEIPEDCDLLFLYAPTTDLSEEEKTMLSEYISNGGNVMLILSNEESERPNQNALLKEYGMEMADGYIADMERCYQGNYFYIFPYLTLSEGMESGISSEMVLLVNSFGMTETDPERDTIELNSFMLTSDNGYAVNGEQSVKGEYILGATASENEGKFTVITAETIIDEGLTSTFNTVENNTLFMNAVTSHFDDVENISIAAKSLAETYNTVQHSGVMGLAAIIGVPIVVLVYGFVKWLKRRKA